MMKLAEQELSGLLRAKRLLHRLRQRELAGADGRLLDLERLLVGDHVPGFRSSQDTIEICQVLP